MEKSTCHITGKETPASEGKKGDEIQASLLQLIRKEYPDFSADSFISLDALNSFRKKYLAGLVEQELGELDHLEKEVVESIMNDRILSENIEEDMKETLTMGQRVADHIAEFGGSWGFIITFFLFLFGWMALNVFLSITMGKDKTFDPYPFILLNLILSCLAAIQAPIIMMSQNRQEQKDRIRSEHDYKVNLKAELEIRMLHEKIDHLMIHQSKRLMEIQQIQADYLEDILRKVDAKS